MNKPTARNKPHGKCGRYMVQNNSVHFEHKKDEYIQVMQGIAYVDGFVVDPVTNITTCLVAIEPFIGKPCMIRVDLAKLSAAASVREFLAERGVIIYHAAQAARFLTESASDAGKFPMRELVQNPGWFAEHLGFYTGSKVIASDELNVNTYWFEPSRETSMRTSGTLHEWTAQVGGLIVVNPMILAMTCIGIESLLLDRLGLSSSMFNFWGQKGTGKTLGEQCAASVFGNGIDPAQGAQSVDPAFVVRFNGTINGFESLLPIYSPVPIYLDEMTEGSAIVVNEACYMMGAGQGKHRRTSDGKAAKRDLWRLNIILSAERSIVDTVASLKKPMLGGQADRAVDIPITEVGMVTSFGSFGSFDAATSHLKRACGEQYGTAAEAILQYCVDNPVHVQEVIEMASAVEAELRPEDCGPGELRVVKRLAGAVAAGHIANLAGVFGCDAADAIDDAFKLITDLWWRERSSSLIRLRVFLDENVERLERGRPDPDCEAVAFVSQDLTVIPTGVFNKEFGDDAKAILAELAGLSAMKTEQKGRHVHRFCNNDFRGYVIYTKKIWPDLDFAN